MVKTQTATFRSIFRIVDFEIPSYSMRHILCDSWTIEGGGGNGEMANLTNGKGKFAIAIFRHYSPFFAIGSF